MNKAVYKNLLQTHWSHPGYWVGVATEAVRSFILRVWVVIILAATATELAAGNLEAAKANIALFFIVYMCGVIVGAIGDYVATKTENYEYEKLSVAYYQKLVGKDMSFYRDSQTGYLVSLHRQYLDSMMVLTRFFRGNVVRTTMALVAPTVVLLTLNWRLGLIAIGIVVVQFAYVIWASSRANKYRAMSHEAYRKVTGEVSDEITNIIAFKSSGMQNKAQSKVSQLAHEETTAFMLRRLTNIKFEVPREIITAGGVALAVYFALTVGDGPASIGLIVLTLTYMFQIVRSVNDLPNLLLEHDDLVTKAYPTLQYFGDSYETVVDPPKPKNLRISTGTITLKNVSFNYTGTKDKSVPVFKNLNIQVRGGQHVGIVGVSGAGKSTLASLLMRFDDVTNGAILIDGTDIRHVRQGDLHKNIAYVPQEPLLFHRTIRENIAYFNNQATEAQIIKAAKAAHAHDFIKSLPDGYESMVGERGIKLSGGQKQRIVIARAILKNAPIMIFDEATSALDTESEKIIQAAMPKIIGKHTAVVIAHRLSTIAGLDQILVMHDGEVIESGTHSELLALGGRYALLWKKQAE